MRIGIDIGGSHIAIGLIQGKSILQKSEYNFTKQDKQNLKAVISTLLEKEIDMFLEKISVDNIEMIGISVPGRPQNGIITSACNLQVDNLNLENVIKQKLDKPVYMKNDGMCAGIAEKEYGALQGVDNGIFLSLGTGIGCAVFVRGQLIEEIRGFGHMIVQKNGRQCKCGRFRLFGDICFYEGFKNANKEQTKTRNVIE